VTPRTPVGACRGRQHARGMKRSTHADLARATVSVGRDLRRDGHQLRAVLRGRREGRAVPDRRRDRRRGPSPGDAGRPRGRRRARLARVPARSRPGDAVRLPGARSLRPGVGSPVQPVEAARRPVRQGDRRAGRRRRVALLVPLRRGARRRRGPRRPARPGRGDGRAGRHPGRGRASHAAHAVGRPGPHHHRGLAGAHHDVGRGQPVLRLGPRPPAPARLPRLGDLRGARARHDDAPPRRARRAPRHVRGHGAPGRDRAPHGARGHGGRAHARPPVRQRPRARRQGPVELLGLQHHRLLRAPQRLHRVRHARPAGHGVQGHGQGAARGRHRGHPRRRLQPHGRGQPPGAHAVVPRDRQRGLLPAGRRRRGPLLRHDRHGQLAAHALAPRAAAHHGLPALLGHRDARRRVPFRPRGDPRPPVPRGRPALGVLRHRPAGPGRVPGQAHRRALGPGRRRLPGGRLPAPVDRVERPVPRHRARLLARRARDAARVREPSHRLLGPLRAHGPQAHRVDQLRHGPRRLHPHRPGVLRREAQRGQRRGRGRRREPQPVVELRRRRAHRRPRDPCAAGPAAPQLPRDAAPVPGRPDALARGRDRAHAARQQQRLLPGQRDHLDGLGRAGRARRRAQRPAGVRPTHGRDPAGAPPAAPPPLLPGPGRHARGRDPGHRLVRHLGQPHGHDRLEPGLRPVRHGLPGRRRPARARPPRRAHRRRLVPAAAQRLGLPARLHAARGRVRRAVAHARAHRVPRRARALRARRARVASFATVLLVREAGEVHAA
ncbi:MAG: hypothetical protein K0R97_2145, partial [Oerskovia sp.]|nr:hypothetical protein [Oerskovia sp.]